MSDTRYRLNKICYALIIKRLIKDDATVKELTEVSGNHKVTIETLMRVFKDHGLVHVCGYEQDKYGRDLIKIYRWGKGKDAQRYRLTPAERSRRYRERKKALALHPTSLIGNINATA